MENCENCKDESEKHGRHEHKPKRRFDFLLWLSLLIVAAGYVGGIFEMGVFSESIFELMNRMWWGIAIGIVAVAIIGSVPKEMISYLLGKGGTFGGLLRATGAGVLLDLCSHGILLVGMKLYERGASLGQVMAFLIASPWNSISLTLILWALIGFWWMLAFLVMSMIIAVFSGWLFDGFVKRGILPANPNTVEIAADFSFKKGMRDYFKSRDYSIGGAGHLLWHGVTGSRMVLRWIFFGVVLASLVRAFVPPESFETLFGPTMIGMGMTLVVATILEVCSEGSTPIAADILTRAAAPGNSFVFLMTGVATDYTEMMSLRETTKSWKIALFLPLVTVPQIIIIGIVMNYIGV
jgi:uncharacterized protein